MEDEFIPNPFEDGGYDSLGLEDRVETQRDCILDLTDAVRDVLALATHCHEDILELAARDAEKDDRIAFLEQMLLGAEGEVDRQCDTEEGR